ncbi:MAG: potassium transporter KefA, partial [Planctomycetota bacterium]
LGFGLQEIFANFVSGLIILFERPVRVGDIVTVGGVEGVVTRIQIRATTIQDWDRRELLVPNREFITNQLINWTLSDPVTRLIVPVGIAYGSDTTRARELLLDIAKRCPHVLNEPEPTVVFRSFGDSALLFELRVFIPTRDCWPEVVSALHFMIDNAFRDAEIEIAFPQRDIHIRSIHSTLPIQPHGMPTSAGEKSGAETAAAPRQDG